jgi:L-ectoine synthase
MIVRTVDELAGSDRDIEGEGWRSRRILRRDDGMGHSLHWTEIKAGTELDLRYRNHFESNLVLAGEGEVTDVDNGLAHDLNPGVMYALDKHDHHVLRARTDMTLVCVFTPPLQGDEKHNAEGGYEPSDT